MTEVKLNEECTQRYSVFKNGVKIWLKGSDNHVQQFAPNVYHKKPSITEITLHNKSRSTHETKFCDNCFKLKR